MCTLGWFLIDSKLLLHVCLWGNVCVLMTQTPSNTIWLESDSQWENRRTDGHLWGFLTAIRARWGCTCALGRLRTSSSFTVTAVGAAGPGCLSLSPPSDLSRYPDRASELEMPRGILSHQTFSPICTITCSAAHWGGDQQRRIHRRGWHSCHARHLSRCCSNFDVLFFWVRDV